MSSRSWLWKKKRNSVFPAAENQSKPDQCSTIPEAWVHVIIPSSSQVTEESLRRTDVEFKSQSTVFSSAPLPGSIVDYQDEILTHPSCSVENIAINKAAGHDEIKQGQSWLSKLGLNHNILSFVKCLNEWKGNKTAVQKGHPHSPRVLSHDNQLGRCQSKEQQHYIPYRLAKLYITKIAKEMHQMKIGHMKVLKELEHLGKVQQEQAITALKNQHSNKMKIMVSQLEAYQELVDKKNHYWQDTIKRLKEENSKLNEEKEELVNEIKLQKETWDKERVEAYASSSVSAFPPIHPSVGMLSQTATEYYSEDWLLKSTTQKLDCLLTQHTLTLEELQKSRLSLEKVQKIVAFQMALPSDQRRAIIISDEVEMEEMPNCLPQKKLQLEVKTTLEMVKELLLKREQQISQLVQSQNWCN